MKEYSEIEQQTKKIYIEQHKNYLLDEQLFERHRIAAQDLRTYDLPLEYFRGIHILDAGCGNTGYFQVAMYNLGVGHVTCMDLGKEWIPELQKTLLHHNIPPSFCSFVEGSTLQIPAEDEAFDLVCSNGVIMHLETPEMAAEAIKELVRVCRIGGSVYAHIGIDKPGIVDRFIVKSLRAAYQEDAGFKNFVDNLNPETLADELISIFNDCSQYDERLSQITREMISDLITLDTTTFLQNMLQVPKQIGPLLSEDWGRQEFKANGLTSIRRPSGSYWLRNDFRRFLAPIHYSLNQPLPSLFYGNGHVKLIGEKMGKK